MESWLSFCHGLFTGGTPPAAAQVEVRERVTSWVDERMVRRGKMEDAGNDIKTGRLSRKVSSIAAGEAHTLAVTGDGKVYSWGRGTFGRLGTGSEADQLFPVMVKFFGSDVEREEKFKIVGIAAGAYHSLAVADDGSIWGWGYNVCGQIGVNGENSAMPRKLEGFLELGSPDSSPKDCEPNSGKPLEIVSVKAGGMMSLAIDHLGGLWMWGNCPNSQKSNSSGGEFSLTSTSAPIPVWNFHGHTVVKVACGNEHVVALVTAGETYEGGGNLLCYSWGGNNHGQLGLGDNESRINPQAIETFNSESPWDVYKIACGASHTAILAKRKRPSDIFESFCWTFGLGDNGQLGHGTTKSFSSPERVQDLPKSIFLTSVDCGLFHTSVVSSAGDVWSWGMEKGLGLCPDARFTGDDAGDAVIPLLFLCNETRDRRFPTTVQVACGAAHTVLLADGGHKLWSWGRGRSGVLGNGKTIDCYTPTLVLWPPLSDDFEESEEVQENKTDENNPRESDERLSVAMEEMKLLETKLSIMEKYASILHGSIFGKPFEDRDIPPSLKSSGSFDIAKEWESMLESSESGKLVRLKMFHQEMLRAVEDRLMKRRIQEIIREAIPELLSKRGSE